MCVCKVSSLLLADLLVDHGPEVGQDLVLTLCPLVTVEHCKSSPEGIKRYTKAKFLAYSHPRIMVLCIWSCVQHLPVICIVDLVLLSDTYSLHATMPGRMGEGRAWSTDRSISRQGAT